MRKTFLGKIGDQLGTGTNLLSGNFGDFSPKIPPKPGWDGEDIVGEYLGPIGEGDKLVTGEFWGIFPKNSPKVGVGTGKTILGKIGDQLGTGTNLLLGNFGEFSPGEFSPKIHQ